jgi:sugar phosphate isomerase/epimerase
MIKVAAVIGAPDLQKDTLAVYSNDLEKGFGRVADLGYQGVELMTKNPITLDGPGMKRLLDGAGIPLVSLCTGHVFGEDGLGLVGPDREVCSRAMKRLKEFVDFAADNFGDGTMVNIGRSRGQGYAEDPNRTLDEMAKAFGELADYARPKGIRLVLEPITVNQTNFINTTRDGIDMVDRVGRDNFGLMLDVYHMNIEDDDIYESIRQAGKRCWFCHFTDNNRKYPGSAHLDFKRIVDTLQEIGYDGYVSMEILPWPDGDTAARKAIAHVKQFISK